MSLELICECCGNAIKDMSDVHVSEDGNFVCEDCIRYRYMRCCNCSRWIKISEDRRVCLECDGQVYKKDINNYSTKPIPRFVNKSTDKRINLNNRYYGLEMEFSHLNPALAKLLFKDCYEEKLIYNKSDGSLSSGVEIVTAPCDKYSIKKLINSMEKGFEFIKKNIKRYSTNAGVHIHVNRKSISPMDIYKLGLLLNYTMTNKEKLLLYYLSGRTRINGPTDKDTYYKAGSVFNIKNVINGDVSRHIALNIQNSNTIEFRLFKSTVNINQLESYIELVNMMIEYVEQEPIFKVSIKNLLDYIENNSTNKMILGKIKRFTSYHGEIQERKLSVSRDDIWKSLKGVNANNYENILNGISSYSNHSNRNLLRVISEVKDGRTFTSGYDDSKNYIVKRLENTLKHLLINKIVKENEQCA